MVLAFVDEKRTSAVHKALSNLFFVDEMLLGELGSRGVGDDQCFHGADYAHASAIVYIQILNTAADGVGLLRNFTSLSVATATALLRYYVVDVA